MTLTGGDVFPIKFHSAEAVRESLQQIWESCLPRRKVHNPIRTEENHYIVPNLNHPVFLLRRKPNLMPLRVRSPSEKVEDRRRKPTTHEVLHWRTLPGR